MRAALRRARDAAERTIGIRTSGNVSLEDLGFSSENRQFYSPSNWLLLRRALTALDIGRDDVFVDFGAGRGRALLVASRFPFRRLVGVELVPELAADAERNLARVRRRARSGPLEMAVGDATAFAIPDDMTVGYLYHPFTGPVFDRVIANVLASWDRRPRPLRLLYNFPFEHRRLVGTGRVRPVAVHRRRAVRGEPGPGEVVVAYEVGAPGSFAPAPALGPWGTAAGVPLGDG